MLTNKSRNILLWSGAVPPEPGKSPIPPGTMRRFHYTDPKNINDILKNGLTLDKARGIEGPKAIWSTPYYPKEAEDHKAIVEFHDDPERYKKLFNSSVFHFENIKPEQIVAVHLPWHKSYRYVKQEGYTSKDLEPHKDDPQYKPVYEQLKKEGL